MRAFLIVILVWLAALPALAAQTDFADTGRVNARLISDHDSVAPGERFYVALETVLDEHWHTYWRNPGDSGEPVQITWTLPDTVSAGEIVWPRPGTIATGPIVNYGFEGAPLFPVAMTLSPNAQPGEMLTLSANVYYLVCKDICVPEETDLSLDLFVGEPVTDVLMQTAIGDALKAAPAAGTIKGGVTHAGETVTMTFTDLPPEADTGSFYFFPNDYTVIDHSTPQKITSAANGLQIMTKAGYGWEDGAQPASGTGTLTFTRNGIPDGIIVDAALGQTLKIGALSSESVRNPDLPGFEAPELSPSTPAGNSPEPSNITLWTALIGAFIGGLILNLMPCVFPVISLKALKVAGMAHGERRAVQRQALLYTAGVLVTFLALTAALLIFKALGQELGWGFQLQSPKLVAALAVLMFIIGLNLLGVFEFGSALQNVGQGLTEKEGGSGSFFTGVLAVIVATPCTAPFMAGAVGYALLQPAFVTLLIFTALAIGFAAPFLLLAYVPGFLKILPKPGAWMERFKEFMAFPMFGAAVWLTWVLTQQAGEQGLLSLLTAALLIGFALWALKGGKALSRGLAALAILGSAALIFTLHPKAVALDHQDAQAWSPEKVAELRAEGRPVFVDFTAAWCVTCKVNERTVLNTDDIRDVFAETNTAFLIGDWTNKNDMIAQELKKHGRAGVPLYLYYGHNDVNPRVLPQVLTKDMVRDVLKGTDR